MYISLIMYSNKNLFLVLLIVHLNSLESQNLVKNPSFEDFVHCPKELGTVTKDVKYWSRATEGTSDYFNECSAKMGIPNNFNGNQTAAFEKAYAGIYLLAPNNYREYLQGELTQTLIKGRRYGITFYISLSEKSSLALKEIGVLFSDKHLDIQTTRVLQENSFVYRDSWKNYSYKKIFNPEYFGDKKGWMKLYTEFTARGKENFITIGNFKDDKNTKTKKTQGTKKASYYYIDMVSVMPLDSDGFDHLETDQIYALKNVLFKSNDFALNESSKKDLESLYAKLKDNPELFIAIHAHTDNDGPKTYNKILSENRAKSVASYLIDLGVPLHRIQWYGHGDEKPALTNASTVSKQKNRRAEFVLSKGRFNPNPTRGSYAETKFEEDN